MQLIICCWYCGKSAYVTWENTILTACNYTQGFKQQENCYLNVQDLATKHGKGTLLDDYDYVMHGKVFKFKDNHNTGQLKVEVYVSYGGLLMQITGSPKELESLEVDSNVFLLMRKV